jgi:hypothetical protein
MGNLPWLKMGCFQIVGIPESIPLKVAALNLFHPTASPLFEKPHFSYCDTTSKERENYILQWIAGR